MGRGGGFSFLHFLFLAGAIALGYWAVKYGPPQYRRMKVREIIGDVANRSRRYGEAENDEFIDKMRHDTIARIHDLGIEDPDLDVQLVLHGRELTVRAIYVEVIKHPFVNKRSVLHFNPSTTIEVGFRNLKPAETKDEDVDE